MQKPTNPFTFQDSGGRRRGQEEADAKAREEQDKAAREAAIAKAKRSAKWKKDQWDKKWGQKYHDDLAAIQRRKWLELYEPNRQRLLGICPWCARSFGMNGLKVHEPYCLKRPLEADDGNVSASPTAGSD